MSPNFRAVKPRLGLTGPKYRSTEPQACSIAQKSGLMEPCFGATVPSDMIGQGGVYAGLHSQRRRVIFDMGRESYFLREESENLALSSIVYAEIACD